jgi:hypothetical protein
MFNLAIDSKRRGCDVVALEVEDVAPGGYTIDRAPGRQRKAGRPVKLRLMSEVPGQCGHALPGRPQPLWTKRRRCRKKGQYH